MHTVELGLRAYVICSSTIGECAHVRGYLGLLTEWIFSLMMVYLSVMRVTLLNITLLNMSVRGLQATLGVPTTIYGLHGLQATLGVPTTIYGLHGPQQTLGTAMTNLWLYMYMWLHRLQ
jgi:hypothetical protein